MRLLGKKVKILKGCYKDEKGFIVKQLNKNIFAIYLINQKREYNFYRLDFTIIPL